MNTLAFVLSSGYLNCSSPVANSFASCCGEFSPRVSCKRRGRGQLRMMATDARPATLSGSSPPQTGGAEEVDVLVVGSGVSGSSLAFRLLQEGSPELRLLLTEARDVVGGNVISRAANGYIWEEGPNTFQPAAHIMRLAVDLGLKDEIVLADHRLPRLVYWDDQLFALPMAPRDIPRFRLLSFWGAIRAGLGAMGFVLPPRGKGEDETVKEFITRHLGKEVFEKMIDPFVSGVYAGDPAKLCMSAAFKKIVALEKLGGTPGIIEGAIIRLGQRKREAPPPDPSLPKWKPGSLGSFRNGLLTLPRAVSSALGPSRVRLEWKLDSLSRRDDHGDYEATYSTPSGPRTVVAKSVAITAPAHAAAKILKDMMATAEALNDIEYPCLWSVSLAYPKSAFERPLRGFGNLIPRTMGVRTLGTIWSSCLFPGRAPEGMELLLSYIGGAQDPGIADLNEQEVINVVDSDVKRILLKKDWSEKPVVVGVRKWPRAIPQYNVGYWDVMKKVEAGLTKYDGLFLGGNYRTGVAFGDCVQWGVDTAPEVVKFLGKVKSKAEMVQ